MGWLGGLQSFVPSVPFVVYFDSVRNMFTASAINFSVLSLLFGGLLCYRIKHKHWVFRLIALYILLHFMKNEVAHSTQVKDNYFKLLQITHHATSSEFNSAVRLRKGTYHPDNLQTGNNDIFMSINELHDAMQTNYKKRMELYHQFGDAYDVLSVQAPSSDDENVLYVNRGIEFVANYLMLILITILFFQNSAKRGLFQKLTIFLVFLGFMIVDMVIDFKFEIEDKNNSMSFSELLESWYAIPFATIPELVNCWRLLLVGLIAFFYFFGILFQMKEEEVLISKTERYYLKLHRINRRMDQEKENYMIGKDIDESWNILNSMIPSVEYIKKYSGKAEGLFKILNSMFSYLYYGIIAVILGAQLYSKYHRQFHAWLNNVPIYS